MPPEHFCAIDFGTSNSAIALPRPQGVQLVELEDGHSTMPTALFYAVENLAPHEAPQQHMGRAAVAAYVEGIEGRLMRSMKSILGSSLANQSTDLGAGRSVGYLDVIGHYLAHLKTRAEREAQQVLTHVVLGRPVFFVDDDAARDAAAQASLAQAARQVGFSEVFFQYEPIAAALDYETTITQEEVVLVADIGGGTSDFSLVRVGPVQRQKIDRRQDILANHGVHVAGTDFDRQIELASLLPHCGFGARGPTGREVPSRVYFDLATWHLINTVYIPSRVAELRRMQSFYQDKLLHQRLMKVLNEHLGHALVALAEAAKIEVAEQGQAHIDLRLLDAALRLTLDEPTALRAIDNDLLQIATAADETLNQAGLNRDQVKTLYFTGGSTGLLPLTDAIAARFPTARLVRGDRLASVAQGLGVHARRLRGGE
jgi:hypothetical chaperone protein